MRLIEGVLVIQSSPVATFFISKLIRRSQRFQLQKYLAHQKVTLPIGPPKPESWLGSIDLSGGSEQACPALQGTQIHS